MDGAMEVILMSLRNWDDSTYLLCNKEAKNIVEEIERLREKIVRAYACIEDKLYDKALNILQQALKEE